jgi:helix-turn-helix protein
MSGGYPIPVQWRRAVRDERGRLSPLAKHVAFNLAEYMNRRGWCNPGVDRLAADTGRDPRTVQRTLAELEQAGYLEIAAGGGRGRTNGYQAVLPVASSENPGGTPPFEEETPAPMRETPAAVHKTPAVVQENPGHTPPEVVVEEVKEGDDEDAGVVDESLTRFLEPFGYLTAEQRREVGHAWREDSAGLVAWAGKALREGDHPTGLFLAGLRHGAHRNGHQPAYSRRRSVEERVVKSKEDGECFVCGETSKVWLLSGQWFCERHMEKAA